MSDRVDVEVTSSSNQSSATNQTEGEGLTKCDQVDASSYPFFMTVHSLVFLVGVLFNGVIMKFYFCRGQRLQSSSIMVYLKNLAAADFLLCLCLPVRIVNYASSSVTIHFVYCSFGAPALFINMYASILFMGYIAANRYLRIVQETSETHILQRLRASRIISTVTWVFLLAAMSVYVILSLRTQTLKSVQTSCEGLQSEQFTLFYKIIHIFSTVTFLVVLVSLVFFYHSTSRRVSQAQQRQPASSCKKLAKSKRNMSVLVAVFCLCFVPYHLVRLPKALLWRSCSWSKVFCYLMELTIVLSVLNVCLDPLIYFIFCKAFRTQLSQRVGSRRRSFQLPMK